MIEDAYNGFLVPLFDTNTFETRLDMLIQDENLREQLGSNAQESISKFSCAKINEDYYRFIFGIE
jgi:glycosyltransferase involved in cell wall biosynthesis